MRLFYIKAGVSATIVGNGEDCFVFCEKGGTFIGEGSFGKLYLQGSVTFSGGAKIENLHLGGTPPGYSQGQSVSAEMLSNNSKVYL